MACELDLAAKAQRPVSGKMRREALGGARKPSAAIFMSLICVAVVSLSCLIFPLSGQSFLSSAYAGGHGSHGNGGGNGNGGGGDDGDGGGGGSGNAYGHDTGGNGSALDAANGSAAVGAFDPPGQDKYDGNSASDKWEAATKLDPNLHPGQMMKLEDLAGDAADYLGGIDFPGKTNLPDQASEAAGSEPKGKASAPGQIKERPGHDPQGKAVGLARKEAAGNASVPVAQDTAPKTQASNPATIDPRSYSHREVLAVNLSPAAVSRARSLGFTTGAPSPFEDGIVITVLTTPLGIDALAAIRQLKRELPADHFHLNSLYRLYRPAMNEDGVKQRTRPASVGNTAQCLDDRCYARAVIQWKTNFAACATGVRIGVIDTSVDQLHPAFSGQRITYASFLPDGRQASPNWHGTGVLSILAGRPDSGTPGLVHQATFFVANIFFAGDDGEPLTDTVSLLRALDWMSAAGATLINMSFSGPQDEIVRSRIASLSERGFVFSAAAGNGGPAGQPAYPAAYPEVIAVTAVNKHLQIFPFATRGPYIDLAAPGVDIWAAIPDAREGYRSGTSFAAPFATAVLAILPRDTARLPKDALLDRMKSATPSAVSGPNPAYGGGLLQAPRICRTQNEEMTYRGVFPGAPKK